MKVTIYRCSNNSYWYKNYIGEEFDVENSHKDISRYKLIGSNKTITIEDTVPIEDLYSNDKYIVNQNDIDDLEKYSNEIIYERLKQFLDDNKSNLNLKQELYILFERAKLFF